MYKILKILFFTLAIIFTSITYAQDKQMVAVLPTIGDVDDDINGAVQDALEQGVVQSKRYGLVARGPAFEQALSEITFQASGAVDDSQMKEFGHAVGADFVCYANIRAVANTFRITYRLIDVASSEIVKVNSKSSSNAVSDFIKMLDDITEDLFSNEAEKRASAEQILVAEREKELKAREIWENLKLSSEIIDLENFISQYSGTTPIAAATERLKDEKAWNTARQTNTISSYERYAAAGNSARYWEQAKDWLEEAYFRLAKDAADISDLDKIDQMYDNCLLLAPNGKLINEIKNIRCNAYYDQAMKLSKSKSADDLRQANKYFSVAQKTCPANKNIDAQMNKNDKAIKKSK